MGTMTSSTTGRSTRRLALVGGLVMLVGACTSSASSEPSSSQNTDVTVATVEASDDVFDVPSRTDAAASSTARGSEGADGAEGATPGTAVALDGVTNEGVLAAAIIIISDGDLEAAIAEGLITEAEAEAALFALETETLARYSS